METSLKTGSAQISLAAQNLGGGGAAAPLARPARTPMWASQRISFLKTHIKKLEASSFNNIN